MARPSHLPLALLIALSVGASGSFRDAAAQTQICSGLLPLGAVAPDVSPDSSVFATGCGTLYHLHLTGGSEGNYSMLVFPACNAGTCAGFPSQGASTFHCLLETGYGCCISAGDYLTLEPSTFVGPLFQSLNDRFNADSDLRDGVCLEAYAGNGMRVLSIPIVRLVSNLVTRAHVIGFTTAFLAWRPTGPPNVEVALEFLPTGVVAAVRPTWGALRLLYR